MTVVRKGSAGSTTPRVFVSSRDGVRKEVGPDEIHVISHLMRVRSVFRTDAALANALGVHRSRISAWKSGGRADRENAAVLANLAAVVGEMEKFLPERAIRDWLVSCQYELQETRPVDALREHRLSDVLQAANALENLAFA